MTPCESCQEEVATNSKVCPHCGHERTTMSGWLAFLSGFVCFVGIMAVREHGISDLGNGLLALTVILGSGWVCFKALMRWRKFI